MEQKACRLTRRHHHGRDRQARAVRADEEITIVLVTTDVIADNPAHRRHSTKERAKTRHYADLLVLLIELKPRLEASMGDGSHEVEPHSVVLHHVTTHLLLLEDQCAHSSTDRKADGGVLSRINRSKVGQFLLADRSLTIRNLPECLTVVMVVEWKTDETDAETILGCLEPSSVSGKGLQRIDTFRIVRKSLPKKTLVIETCLQNPWLTRGARVASPSPAVQNQQKLLEELHPH